jgi:hypothetical protein
MQWFQLYYIFSRMYTYYEELYYEKKVMIYEGDKRRLRYCGYKIATYHINTRTMSFTHSLTLLNLLLLNVISTCFLTL